MNKIIRAKAFGEAIHLYEVWFRIVKKEFVWNLTKDPLINPYTKLLKHLLTDDGSSKYDTLVIKEFIKLMKIEDEVIPLEV